MRKGTVVYKYDQEGNLVHTYTSLVKAYKSERVSSYTLKEIIESSQKLRGFSFQYGTICTCRRPHTLGPSPWESITGFFQVDGWAATFP